jgi:plastocyanin
VTRRSPARRSAFAVAVRAAAALGATAALAACGDDGEVATVPVPDDPDVVIVSEDIAFEPTEIEVPANETITIVDENRDSVAHNVHLPDAPGSPKTKLLAGPSTQALEVTLEPGEYRVVCDLHPNMRATITAVE